MLHLSGFAVFMNDDMGGLQMSTRKQLLRIILSSIPLIILIILEIYLTRFDGWGAWGTGPLFLLPAILGIAIGISFGIDLVRAIRSGESIRESLMLLIISLLPIGWLFVRRFVM